MDKNMFSINSFNKTAKRAMIKIFSLYKLILAKQNLKMLFKIVPEKKTKINQMIFFRKVISKGKTQMKK
jgi:exosortase/archaeosortase